MEAIGEMRNIERDTRNAIREILNPICETRYAKCEILNTIREMRYAKYWRRYAKYWRRNAKRDGRNAKYWTRYAKCDGRNAIRECHLEGSIQIICNLNVEPVILIDKWINEWRKFKGSAWNEARLSTYVDKFECMGYPQTTSIIDKITPGYVNIFLNLDLMSVYLNLPFLCCQ